jgi:hypothetical protein
VPPKDAGESNHSTPRPTACIGAILSRTNHSDDADAGVTAAWAMRVFSPETEVAEFDRLSREALASVKPLELEVDRYKASLLEAIRQTQRPNRELAEEAEILVPALEKALDRAECALQLALMDLQWGSEPLAVQTGKMWQALVAQGTQGGLKFRYQSPDPREGPQTLHPSRIPDLRFVRTAVLWGGTPELDELARLAFFAEIKAMGDDRVPIPRPDTWLLDGRQLLRGRIVRPVFGLLGDPDAPVVARKPGEITVVDRMAAEHVQQVLAGVLERATIPELLWGDTDALARLLYGTREPAGEPETDDPPPEPSQELFPAAMAESEGINLRYRPPTLARYQRGGPYKPASIAQMDECIAKLAALAGGTLPRSLLRSHGRYWLRHYRHVDADGEDLEKRRMLPKHRSSRGTQGKLRPSI